jgi:hypothetical protein
VREGRGHKAGRRELLTAADAAAGAEPVEVDHSRRTLLRTGAAGAVVAFTGVVGFPDSAEAGVCGAGPVYETHDEGICPDDPTAAADLVTLLNSVPEGAVISFSPGSYDLSLWSSYALQKSITLRAHPGTVTLTGPGKADIASHRFLDISESGGSDPVRVVLEGLSFVDWGETIFSAPTQPIEELTIRSCRFDEVVNALNTWIPNTLDTGIIRLLRVEDCEITRTSGHAILMRCLFDRALVLRNRFSTLDATAISLGYTKEGFGWLAEGWKKAVVSHNVCTDIVSPLSGGDVHGVIVAGREAIISHNHIENVHHQGAGTGNEGIYTKAHYCDISHNTLVDAGLSEAAITIKGSDRGDLSADTPGGYANRVCNNTILATSTAPSQHGVMTYEDDTQISNNYFENLNTAIKIIGENLLVSGNLVRGCYRGVSYSGHGSGVSIVGNAIHLVELQNSDGIIMLVKPVAMPGDPIPSDWLIDGNSIRGDASSGFPNRRGISIWCGGGGNPLDDIYVEGVVISNNQLSDLVTCVWSKNSSLPSLTQQSLWIHGNYFRSSTVDVASTLLSEPANVIVEGNLSK